MSHNLTWLTSFVCFSVFMLLNFLSRYIHHIAAKSVKHMIQQMLGKPVTQTADEAIFGYCVHVWKKTVCIRNTKRDIKYVFGSICKTALKCL